MNLSYLYVPFGGMVLASLILLPTSNDIVQELQVEQTKDKNFNIKRMVLEDVYIKRGMIDNCVDTNTSKNKLSDLSNDKYITFPYDDKRNEVDDEETEYYTNTITWNSDKTEFQIEKRIKTDYYEKYMNTYLHDKYNFKYLPDCQEDSGDNDYYICNHIISVTSEKPNGCKN